MQPERAHPLFDADGYLIDPSDWSEDLARAIAREQGIELGDEHWEVIRFMRHAYEQRHIAPDSRHVVRFCVERFGPEARNKLFELFPYGYPGQACRIAGMKRPRAWSTG